ncbi:hypothetical protein PORY_000764 [Pneumocystis oryctolagi]|uniref:Uncharacterized protein n=1 Tax=Pneumocystis oryctolagi TaxID=42067 RepID=A0ACB7CIV8_9ASCO|nr:hypothetical protein PORY_000764 [Pneumocystis oryctolagi]
MSHQKQTQDTEKTDSKDTEDSQKEEKISFRHRFLKKIKHILLGPVPSHKNVIPEVHANIVSRLFFNWLNHLIVLGYKRPLEQTDLWYIDEERSSKVLGDKLYENYQRRKGSKHALLWALNDTFRKHYWLSGVSKLINDSVVVSSTVVIKYIIIFSQKKELYNKHPDIYPKPNIYYAILLCFVLFAMQTISSFCLHHSFYRSMMVGALSRTALISCIYRKSLIIKNKQRLIFDNAKIMNLATTDTANIDVAAGYGNLVWTSIVQIVLVFIFLFINLGISVLAGIILLLSFLPIMALTTRNLLKKNLEISKVTDIRIRLTNEVFQYIKAIKFYSWERYFLNNILKTRLKEAKILKSLHILRSSVDSFSMNISFYCIISTFITYFKIKHSLDPAIVFPSLTLFNIIRVPFMLFIFGMFFRLRAFSFNIKIALVLISNMLASVKRIDAMLSIEDTECPDSIKKIQNTLEFNEPEDPNNSEIEESDYSLIIKNGYFTWLSNDIDESKKEINAPLKKTFFKKKRLSDQQNISKKNSNCSEEKNHFKEKDEPFEEKTNEKNITEDASQEQDQTKGNSNKEHNNPELHLKNINLKIKKGELVCIVGPVGSGKSTLLLSIINETYKIHGTINLNGTVSYCSQISWIENSSVIDNILFGRPYDEDRYQKVVEVCCLDFDFQNFPHRDLTEIGEKGVTISGGQKQRINIARSIYFDADIVLLDDSLSSVDSHVGKDIFEKCICDFLKDKTVIFVTHQLNVLNKADKIVYLENGRIMEMGSYSDLISKQEHFYNFVEGFIRTEKESFNKEIKKEKEKKNENEFSTLMQQEEREIGAIKWIVYIEFIRASGGLWLIPLIAILLVVFEFVNIGNNLWLSFWSKNKFQKSPNFYITIYIILGIIQTFLYFIIYFTFYTSGKHATTNLHHKAVERVVRAPMSFFDTTPLGRIIGRFTKDIKILDNMLVDSYLSFALTFSYIVSIFTLIIIFLHYFSIPLIFLLSLFFVLMSIYRASSREIKRLDSLRKSDLYAQINETLTGLTVIRAYQEQIKFKHRNEKKIDLSNNELPYSLKGINIHINKGEKVGIVGRTGAGKSSIMVALYRLVELSRGSIIIDGIPISEIGLHDLRSRLSIIPQEPTLFEGTIRSNLDPFNEYTDQEIWSSLERSWFLDSIKKYTSEKELPKFSLEWNIEIDGQNFSPGQRQLLMLARALLRKSKIVIFDEATSNVDAKTESKIQNTIQTEFKDATLLCIGNRIRTVINYDTIIVISSGTLVESGSPRELFNKPNGAFRSFCINAGITSI